jgi:uncharacterized protein YjbI with pentapeptide repeats
MNAEQDAKVWETLVKGGKLDRLGLDKKDGRFDVGHLLTQEPTIVRRFDTRAGSVAEVSGQTKLSGIRWRSLDFSDSRLNGLLFSDCEITDCVFDRCRCQDWGVWGTLVSDTSFVGADMRGAALGAVEGRKRNVFRNVDFSQSDLRRIACTSAEFVACTFRGAKLSKVNFGGSSFSDCAFEGELNEVTFNHRAFKADFWQPNEMTRVDFRTAQLRSVEFRGLDLHDVRFPEDADHLILKNYPQTLDKLIQQLRYRTDIGSKKLAAYLGVYRKWVGQKQERGVLNKNDLREIGGEEALQMVLQTIDC